MITSCANARHKKVSAADRPPCKSHAPFVNRMFSVNPREHRPVPSPPPAQSKAGRQLPLPQAVCDHAGRGGGADCSLWSGRAAADHAAPDVQTVEALPCWDGEAALRTGLLALIMAGSHARAIQPEGREAQRKGPEMPGSGRSISGPVCC